MEESGAASLEDATRKRALEGASSSTASVLDDRDIETLKDQLHLPKSRVLLALQNESTLGTLKVSDLKLIINYLRSKTKKGIRLTGNKSELIHRIAEELFNAPVQRSLSSTSAPPSAKRPRITPPASTPHHYTPPAISYATRNLVVPASSRLVE